MFEDTKREVIRIHVSKKNKQHNGQKKKYKDKQRSTKHTHKTKDRITRTPHIFVGTMRFWNNLHQVRSKSKDWNDANILK
jgi:hypothetical protein